MFLVKQLLSKFLDQTDATNTPSSSDERGQYCTSRKVRCYKCKKLGHIQRNCPYNKNQSTESIENRKGQGKGSNMKSEVRFVTSFHQEKEPERANELPQQDALKLECICLYR